jgi:ABC-type branched-subunit amino acid transport system substrate-binding protein
MADQASLAQIAERYRAAWGRPVTMEAAYGYDAVAIAAGIVRHMGPDALTPAALTISSGFRGATGTFRLRPDGSVDRPLSLYRFKGGALELVDPAPQSF